MNPATTATVEPPLRVRSNCKQDRHGRYVPWFVWWKPGGDPDFRVIDKGKVADAVRFGKCWMCGAPLGRNLTFVIGPMCAVNRVTSEPPNHHDCAEYAARVCPFLTNPAKKVRATDLPEDRRDPGGMFLDRNPGVVCLWTTRRFKPFRPPLGADGILFELGDPEQLAFLREGRPATRAEILESIDGGMPLLREACSLDQDPASSHVELSKAYDRVLTLVPA